VSDTRTTRAGSRSNRRDQADRRQEIIDAAAAIFKEKGYAGTSIQDVADAVDILKGSLYYYIKSKDDLLFEVVQEVHRGGLANLEKGKEIEGSALERIRSFVVRHMTYNARNLVKMTVFFHDFRSLGPERQAMIVEERDLYDQYLRGMIVAGQKEGCVRSDVDPRMAAFSILGSMNWMYQWYRPDGSKPIEEIAAEFAEMAVDSVRDSSWNGPA
jgi:AcrR family transcriptional regulator